MTWNFLSQMRLLVFLILFLKTTKEAWPSPKHPPSSMPFLVAELRMGAPGGQVRTQALLSTLNNPWAGSRGPPLVLALAYSLCNCHSPHTTQSCPCGYIRSFIHSFTSFILSINHLGHLIQAHLWPRRVQSGGGARAQAIGIGW